jgi:hypothetical protein
VSSLVDRRPVLCDPSRASKKDILTDAAVATLLTTVVVVVMRKGNEKPSQVTDAHSTISLVKIP